MTQKYFHHQLDGLHLVLVVDVLEVVLHVSEALEIIFNQYLQNQAEMMYDMTKIYFHQLLDRLHLVLVVDVHEDVDKEKKSWKSTFAVRKMLQEDAHKISRV